MLAITHLQEFAKHIILSSPPLIGVKTQSILDRIAVLTSSYSLMQEIGPKIKVLSLSTLNIIILDGRSNTKNVKWATHNVKIAWTSEVYKINLSKYIELLGSFQKGYGWI